MPRLITFSLRSLFMSATRFFSSPLSPLRRHILRIRVFVQTSTLRIATLCVKNSYETFVNECPLKCQIISLKIFLFNTFFSTTFATGTYLLRIILGTAGNSSKRGRFRTFHATRTNQMNMLLLYLNIY